jgi:hypothetical protein
MNVVRPGVCLALIALAAACGSSTAPPSTGTGGGMTITGNERLGWSETGDGADGFVYAAYVDDVRKELTQTTCTPSGESEYACESPLPPLTTGTHTLQLSAAIRYGASLIEGPKSDPVVVTVTGSGTNLAVAVSSGNAASSVPAQNGATRVPSCGLAEWDPTHVMAWTSDGELMLVDPARRSTQALAWSVDADANWRVMALASRFEGTARIVYAALTSTADSEPRLRVSRYREVNGILGERAVLAEGALPYQPARATASFGPDGHLYLAFAWTAPSAAPRPFVVAVDPSAPGLFVVDPRFTAPVSVAATWAVDGRFWIVERSGGQYTLRPMDTAGLTFAATPALIGIESFQTTKLALFAVDGSGWVATPENPLQVQKAEFLTGNDGPFDALFVSGKVTVACSTAPRLSLAFGNGQQ